MCLHLGVVKNGWRLHGKAEVSWTGRPRVPLEIGVEDNISITGYDLSVGTGLPLGVSVGIGDTNQRQTEADRRSNSRFDGVDFTSPPAAASAVDSDKLTQTVTPYIALQGWSTDLKDPLGDTPAPAAHVCAHKSLLELDRIVGLGHC